MALAQARVLCDAELVTMDLPAFLVGPYALRDVGSGIAYRLPASVAEHGVRRARLSAGAG
jgi:hypothetical protein